MVQKQPDQNANECKTCQLLTLSKIQTSFPKGQTGEITIRPLTRGTAHVEPDITLSLHPQKVAPAETQPCIKGEEQQVPDSTASDSHGVCICMPVPYYIESSFKSKTLIKYQQYNGMFTEIIPATIKIAQPTELLISKPQQAELSTQITVNLQQIQQLLGNDPSGLSASDAPSISMTCCLQVLLSEESRLEKAYEHMRVCEPRDALTIKCTDRRQSTARRRGCTGTFESKSTAKCQIYKRQEKVSCIRQSSIPQQVHAFIVSCLAKANVFGTFYPFTSLATMEGLQFYNTYAH
ncbi:hypothetical protein Anapl_04675 [Anas platyrhynchos]|uniref:Uncharacterized protein n=1 Tax=Anas platyrhynchos TaxID=8839 RepID=R0KDN1_ANAPL|nr:hypothetical protein Anapl_04675 [Anas platyrhynchos]